MIKKFKAFINESKVDEGNKWIDVNQFIDTFRKIYPFLQDQDVDIVKIDANDEVNSIEIDELEDAINNAFSNYFRNIKASNAKAPAQKVQNTPAASQPQNSSATSVDSLPAEYYDDLKEYRSQCKEGYYAAIEEMMEFLKEAYTQDEIKKALLKHEEENFIEELYEFVEDESHGTGKWWDYHDEYGRELAYKALVDYAFKGEYDDKF